VSQISFAHDQTIIQISLMPSINLQIKSFLSKNVLDIMHMQVFSIFFETHMMCKKREIIIYYSTNWRSQLNNTFAECFQSEPNFD
jgi:hypothetical protein